MYPSYRDILSRIEDEPLWFDEHAVPRFCEFAPSRSASIHVDECALAEITCQACGRLFRVAFSTVNVRAKHIETMKEFRARTADSESEQVNIRPVADAIRERTLHYGDPPNVNCCLAGNSMNSEPRRVIEYWVRRDPAYVHGKLITDPGRYFEWTRDHSLEVDISSG